MNNDLISRSALKCHKFVGIQTDNLAEIPIKAYQQGWNDAIDAIIDNAPTVEERPQGEWIDKDVFGEEVYCSECGHMEKKEKFIWSDVNYCYFCGAKMKEKDNADSNY